MQVQVCPHCDARTVPSPSGECPACRFNVRRELTEEERQRHQEKADDQQRGMRNEIVNTQFSTGVVLLIAGLALPSISAAATGGVVFPFLGVSAIPGLILIGRSVVLAVRKR